GGRGPWADRPRFLRGGVQRRGEGGSEADPPGVPVPGGVQRRRQRAAALAGPAGPAGGTGSVDLPGPRGSVVLPRRQPARRDAGVRGARVEPAAAGVCRVAGGAGPAAWRRFEPRAGVWGVENDWVSSGDGRLTQGQNPDGRAAQELARSLRAGGVE